MSEPGSTQDRIIRGMVGRDLEHRYPERASVVGDEVLRVEHWNVDHPTQIGRQIIVDASFNVHAGEVVGIAGLMGAGRTELAMSIFGRTYGRNIRGEIYKDGKPIQIRNVSEAIGTTSRTRPRTASTTASTSSTTSATTSPRQACPSSPRAAG